MQVDSPRLLITGVSGLIGRILFVHLSPHFDVIGLDQHFDPSPRYALENETDLQPEKLIGDRFFQCDVTDRSRLYRILREQNVRIIIHLAAVLESETNIDKIRHVNIQGTKNILEAPGIDRILVSSSVMTMFGYLTSEPYRSLTIPGGAPRPVRRLTVKDDPPRLDRRTDSIFVYCQTKIIGEELSMKLSANRSLLVIRFGWVNIRDQPGETWYRTVWLSHRDLCAFIDRCLAAPGDLSGIYYAVSNNARLWLDLEGAKDDLHYIPLDGATELSSDEIIADRRIAQME